MRKPRHIFLAVFLAFFGAMARSEKMGSAVMLEAEALNSRGDFRATVLLLEPLLANNAAGLSPGEMGDGWVLLGTANQFLGEYEKARRNFEAAIRLLKDDPKEARRYAAALDNLGSLEMEEGQIAASNRLRVKATRRCSKRRETTWGVRG
jgi:tetratricopeptide (TPR) repeat protein